MDSFPDEEFETLLPKPEGGRIFVSCPYQKECWKDIRQPKIRAAAKDGVKIFLPYLCSYQTEGDLEKCGHHDDYVRKEGEVESFDT